MSNEQRLLEFVRYIATCQNSKMGIYEWRKMAQDLLKEIK